MVLTPGDAYVAADNRPTVALPASRRPSGTGRGRARWAPLGIAATVNAAWAAATLIGPLFLIVLAEIWGSGGIHAAGPAVRDAMAVWVLAHGVPVEIAGEPFALVPLGVSLFVVWRAVIAGRNTARAAGARRGAGRGLVAAVCVAAGVAYGAVGALAAGIADGPGIGVSVDRAAITCALFGTVCALAGAGIESGRARRSWARLPAMVRGGIRTGVVASAFVIAAGAVATGIAVAVAGSTAASILSSYHTGVFGQAGLVLVCLAYAPNISVWAAAFLAGPGFSLAGAPNLPVFAALPSGQMSGTGQLLLVTPFAVGCVAALLVARYDARRAARGRRIRGNGAPPVVPSGQVAAGRILARAVVSGLTTAAVLAFAGMAAAGAAGPQLLAHTGEVGWQFAAVCGGGAALGSLVGAAVVGVFRRPR